MQDHARVVVVGGGMMGVGILYHLAAEGWTDVMLLEKGELTSGSTWHAAGLCTHFIADYNMAKIHKYAVELYPTLEEKTGQYVSWHGSGSIRLALDETQLDWFKHIKAMSAGLGFPMELIDRDKIKQINPFITLDGVLMGAWTPDDGHVDPAGVCNALARAARDIGASIVTRNRVLDIKPLPSGEWRVFTEQGEVTCEHVVNAGGCYAREIGKWVGIDTPIINMEHHYVVTEPVPEFVERDEEIPVMRDPWPSSYYRQEQKSGLIGIYEPRGQEAWEARGGFPEWDSDNELFDANFDRIGDCLGIVFERMPILSELGIRRVVNGAIPHTPDDNPLLGPAGGLRNFWQCCGSAIGIVQGAGCGKYLAQWMVHGDSEINMAGVDPRRFGHYADGDYARAKAYQEYGAMYATVPPGEQRAAGRRARTTPLHDKLLDKGCVHTEAFGWERPDWFAPDGVTEEHSFRRSNIFDIVGDECRAVRERIGIMDLSSFAKFDVTGADAEVFLNRLCANRMPRSAGGIVLAHLLSEQGRIQSEATVTRLADDRFYVLSGSAWQIRDFDWLTHSRRADEQVEITDVSDGYGNLVVVGPRSRDTLSGLTNADLSNNGFRWLTGQEIEVAGVPVRALRVNYAGELGWELHVPMNRLAEVYDAVWKAGETHGIADFGARALNSLRMEKAYRGIGAELTNEITLIEADMERFLELEKNDFVGRDATVATADDGIAIKLVYCEVDTTDADALGAEDLFKNDRVVGITTSGAYGYAVGKSLLFAYVEPGLARAGETFQIPLLGEMCTARVLSEPAYDPHNKRLRM
jgi:dimethylglycine dehydrogenase